MLCQKCGLKEASIYITEIVNSNVKKTYLCEDCAKEESGLGNVAGDLFSYLTGLINIESKLYNSPSGESTIHCPLCNSTIEDFKKRGKVGCGECYEVFEPQLKPLIKRLHGTTNHLGKKANLKFDEKALDENSVGINIKEKEIYKLEKSLKDAIREERYEEAAVLRDEIKQLKG